MVAQIGVDLVGVLVAEVPRGVRSVQQRLRVEGGRRVFRQPRRRAVGEPCGDFGVIPQACAAALADGLGERLAGRVLRVLGVEAADPCGRQSLFSGDLGGVGQAGLTARGHGRTVRSVSSAPADPAHNANNGRSSDGGSSPRLTVLAAAAAVLVVWSPQNFTGVTGMCIRDSCPAGVAKWGLSAALRADDCAVHRVLVTLRQFFGVPEAVSVLWVWEVAVGMQYRIGHRGPFLDPAVLVAVTGVLVVRGRGCSRQPPARCWLRSWMMRWPSPCSLRSIAAFASWTHRWSTGCPAIRHCSRTAAR